MPKEDLIIRTLQRLREEPWIDKAVEAFFGQSTKYRIVDDSWQLLVVFYVVSSK